MRHINARELAYSVLLDVERNNAYSNIGLNHTLNAADADARERAQATRLVYGVLERKLTLDGVYGAYLRKGTRIKPNVRTLLRLGTYELTFCDGVPARAAVNEYVSLAKREGCGYASGMINAVLRRTAENGLILPSPDDPSFLIMKYSVPAPLIGLFREVYSDDLTAFLDSLCRKARVYGRVNTVKTDFPSLQHELASQNIAILPVDGLPELFYFDGSAAFRDTEAFRNGLFYIQDLSSACAGKLLDARDRMRVLDVCAAPGGKSFFAALSMHGTGEVVSRDIHAHKLRLIEDEAKKLGLANIVPQLFDAGKTPGDEAFDRVICDVPCSGLGVIRKKPELRYRELSDIGSLCELQYGILCAAAGAVKKGGRIVYSTCTVTRSENEDIVARFLSLHSEFQEVRPALPFGEYGEYGVRFSPHRDDCDGFYACAMEKT